MEGSRMLECRTWADRHYAAGLANEGPFERMIACEHIPAPHTHAIYPRLFEHICYPGGSGEKFTPVSVPPCGG